MEYKANLTNNETGETIDELPTIKEIIASTGMTQTEFANHYGMPLRTIQNWCQGKRQCPRYIRDFLVYIIESEEKEKKLIKMQFESGNDLRCLRGKSEKMLIYAECDAPKGASRDYGYITMKKAILKQLTEEEKEHITFCYDRMEKYLYDDAEADCSVEVGIRRAPDPLIAAYKID